MKLWKTTIVIWSYADEDPQAEPLRRLAEEADSGNRYCSKQVSELVQDAEKDADWDGTEFFYDRDAQDDDI